MNFIRKMRKHDKYDEKDLKHCLYGLDADLIMLGLVSREKHFTLLREKLVGNGKPLGKSLMVSSARKNGPASDEFHLLEVSLLRDMLFLEFKPRENFSYRYILERVVDDFAFMWTYNAVFFFPTLKKKKKNFFNNKQLNQNIYTVSRRYPLELNPIFDFQILYIQN